MTLTSGRFIGHEYDRMIVRFSMHDGAREIPCAISTSAMDYLEPSPQVRPEQREAQFTRLRAPFPKTSTELKAFARLSRTSPFDPRIERVLPVAQRSEA